MKVLKIVFITLLISACSIFVFALYKTFQDKNNANSYVEYVTDSTNRIVAEVEEVHTLLNKIHFKNGEEHLNELERKLVDFNGLIDGIEQEKGLRGIPYESDEVSDTFDQYLVQARGVSESFSGIIESIKNLEEKDNFNIALQKYIDESELLKQQSSQMQEVLSKYSQSCRNIDLKRLLYGINVI